MRLHALDVRLTLKGGLTSTGRAEVARAFGGTSQVDAAAAAVGQLDATALGVDALLIDDAYAATAESLGRRVARHYALNLLRQVHRVCGSLDLVTKTPLHVARAVGGGLGDFLWRPVEGAATGSALGLASGVARGTGALIGGVYDGSLGAVSSLTAGVGATVAALSMAVWKSTTGLGGPHQTSELSISVKSKSIRLSFGRIDGSRRVLEARRKASRRNRRIRSVEDLSSAQARRRQVARGGPRRAGAAAARHRARLQRRRGAPLTTARACRPGQDKGDSTSLQRERSARARSEKASTLRDRSER